MESRGMKGGLTGRNALGKFISWEQGGPSTVCTSLPGARPKPVRNRVNQGLPSFVLDVCVVNILGGIVISQGTHCRTFLFYFYFAVNLFWGRIEPVNDYSFTL